MKIDVGLRQITRSLRQPLALVLATLVLAGFIAPGVRAAQATPAATVDQLHVTLIGVMQQAGALGFDGRYQTLAPTVMASFNLPLMAQVTVGRHWRSLSEEQKASFIDAFSRMTLVTYATRFDDYSGERFEFVAETQTAKSVVVKTQLVKANGERIRLNYILRKYGEEWRIIDVLAKGSYSELATRRSEYSSILKREGFPALLSKLNNKVAELVQKGRAR